MRTPMSAHRRRRALMDSCEPCAICARLSSLTTWYIVNARAAAVLLFTSSATETPSTARALLHSSPSRWLVRWSEIF